jgi:methylated-DNA-protein-cysteine methyltransferase-like protein
MTFQAQREFTEAVLAIIANSREGELLSFGQVAQLAHHPNHARQVGKILAKLPKNTSIPWFRVVNSKRQISFSEGSESYWRQRKQLEQEGWLIQGNRIFPSQSASPID